MISNFLPKSNEIRELSIQFNESLRGFGFESEVLIPKVVDLADTGYHPNIGYDDADKFTAYISIDPHPKTKLLQKLGWNIESDDNKPLICYMSRYLQPISEPRSVNTTATEVLPTKYTLLKLSYNYNDIYGKEFIVSKVTSNEFNPVYYILLIVPYRPQVIDNPDPSQDNNTTKLNIQETNSDFRFVGKVRSSDVDIKY